MTGEAAQSKDGLATLNTALLNAYNLGVIKQVEQRHTQVAGRLAALLVLMSAPEAYGKSYIEGHYDAGATGIARTGNAA